MGASQHLDTSIHSPLMIHSVTRGPDSTRLQAANLAPGAVNQLSRGASQQRSVESARAWLAPPCPPSSWCGVFSHQDAQKRPYCGIRPVWRTCWMEEWCARGVTLKSALRRAVRSISNGHVEILTGRERRRRWSVEAKLRIVAETEEPGACVKQVAARHDVYILVFCLDGALRFARAG